MLMDPDAILRATEFVDDTMFYREGHRRIFRAMVAHHGARRVSSIRSRSPRSSRAQGELEASGGKDYIGFLVDAVPTAANVEYHAKIVREKALLRRLIEVSTAIVARGVRVGAAPATELLDEAEHEDLPGQRSSGRPKASCASRSCSGRRWSASRRSSAAARSITGVASGFKDLDELTSGFQPSDLIIVAGASVDGKDRVRASTSRSTPRSTTTCRSRSSRSR